MQWFIITAVNIRLLWSNINLPFKVKSPSQITSGGLAETDLSFKFCLISASVDFYAPVVTSAGTFRKAISFSALMLSFGKRPVLRSRPEMAVRRFVIV